MRVILNIVGGPVIQKPTQMSENTVSEIANQAEGERCPTLAKMALKLKKS